MFSFLKTVILPTLVIIIEGCINVRKNIHTRLHSLLPSHDQHQQHVIKMKGNALHMASYQGGVHFQAIKPSCMPPHKTLPCTPIIHNSICLLLSHTVLNIIKPSSAWSSNTYHTHTLTLIYFFYKPSIIHPFCMPIYHLKITLII